MIHTKDDALQAFELNRKEFLERCRAIARRAAYSNPFRQATIDDVREEIVLPEGVDGRVFGAVFSRDEWERIGFTKSKQSINHGRPISVFRLKSYVPAAPVVLPEAFPKKEEKPIEINKNQLL
jgi:hypothetical protein